MSAIFVLRHKNMFIGNDVTNKIPDNKGEMNMNVKVEMNVGYFCTRGNF